MSCSPMAMWKWILGRMFYSLRITHVLLLPTGDVEVDPEEDVLKALGRVIHEAELEALLVVEGLSEGPA